MAEIYIPLAGTMIREAAGEAITRAKARGSPVTFVFSGDEITVTGGDDAEVVAAAYMRRVQERHEAWKASPEGVAHAEREQQILARYQADTDRLIETIDVAFSSHRGMLEWIRDFTRAVDRVGVNYDKQTLLRRLKEKGFRQSEHTGLAPGAYEADPALMARYLIGQMIDGMVRASGPHPIAASFAQQTLDRMDAVWQRRGEDGE